LAAKRAVVCSEFGPLETLVVEEQPAPDPGEGMVVVDVAAAGVNFVGGGIGLAAAHVTLALGTRVIAAASTPDKLEAAVAMGAETTIDCEEEDLKARTRDLSGSGVDVVVVDPVGGHHAESALRATPHLGRYCVIGFASGPIPSIPLNQVLLNNRTVVGLDWGG
jgi:NADPH2:quinone reductase